MISTKISKLEMRVAVKPISCEVMSGVHEFDSLELEAGFGCKVVY